MAAVGTAAEAAMGVKAAFAASPAGTGGVAAVAKEVAAVWVQAVAMRVATQVAGVGAVQARVRVATGGSTAAMAMAPARCLDWPASPCRESAKQPMC